MLPETPKLLEDIKDSGSFILKITISLNEASYFQDRVIRQAVERNFEIIGEALIRLRRLDPDSANCLGEVNKIIGFRNILSHAYDNIDHEVVWDVIRLYLPELITKVTKLLENV